MKSASLADWERLLDAAGFEDDGVHGTFYVPDGAFRQLKNLVPWGSPGSPAGLVDHHGPYVLFSRGVEVRPVQQHRRVNVLKDNGDLDRLVRNSGIAKGCGYKAFWFEEL